MATVFECDFNDTDFPDKWGGGIAWDPGPTRDNGASVSGAGLSPLVGTMASGDNLAVDVGGEYSKILTAAGNRTGYKGFRIYVGDDTNIQTGGFAPECTILTNTELWVRFYARFSTGFAWDKASGQDPHYCKMWRTNGTADDPIFGPGYGSAPDTNKAWGLHVVASDNLADQEYGGGFSWYESQGSSFTGDNNFNCYEYHIKKNTGVGNGDGVFETWFNGTLKESRSDIYYKSGSADWGAFRYSNQDQINGNGFYIDIADIKIVNSGGPIGLIGGAPTTYTSGSSITYFG